MQADEAHLEDSRSESHESRARTGPRHAAPRKPLLTRLQIPAGKAMALAAMPTAVLMGMGLTPTLAQAKPMPKNPFRDGPCVTQPDASPQDPARQGDAQKNANDKATKDDGSNPSSDPSGKAAAGDGKDGQQAGTGKASPSPSPSASAPARTPGTTKAPLLPSGGSSSSTSGSSQGGLLSGLGNALGDILSPTQQKSATPAPSPSPTAHQSTDPAQSPSSAVGKVTDTAKDTVGKVTDTAKHVTDTAKKATDGLKDTVDGVKDKATPQPSPSADDPLAPDANGKKPYPCVVEKKSAGTDETPPFTLPDVPWRLEASSLLLKGLDYHGVVNVRTANGQTKQVLKFTADDGIDIGDLHQTVDGPQGRTYHVQAAPGSTSTIRGGRVTMYTERLQGNLFGVLPIVFDPEHPPPLNTPIAYFTDVHIIQASQFGGNLTVPGLHSYFTQ